MRTGAILIAAGSTWMMLSYAAFDMLFLQLIQTDVAKPAAYRIIDGGAAPWQTYFDVVLLCVVLGPAVLGFGLRRNGRTSWLPMGLWIIGVVTYAATDFAARPLPVIALLVCTAGLYGMGRAVDSGRSPRRHADPANV